MTTSWTPPAELGWQVPAVDVVRWTGRRHDWCVVVPVINEGERIASQLATMSAAGIPGIADVIIVDGGSTDGSLEPERLDAHDVTGLLVKRGPGRLSAQLRCGYAYALEQGYRGIVTIDGNDKDDPGEIPGFIAAMEDGVDFVQASRFLPGGRGINVPPSRTWAIRLVHAPALSVASGFHWTDTTQGFRAYRSEVLRDPRVAPFRDVFASYELLAYLSYRVPNLGYRCVELPSTRRYPEGAVPTKISRIGGKVELMSVLLTACLGRYDPRG